MVCYACGELYDEHSEATHNHTPKHICNMILHDYNNKKKSFNGNREGILIFGYTKVETEKISTSPTTGKLIVSVKPKQKVKFFFTITNDAKKEDMLVVGFQLGHPQPQFQINHNPYVIGNEPCVLESKTTLSGDVSVTFEADDIGHYEMPIMFLFVRESNKKNLIIIREMVVHVQEIPSSSKKRMYPYKEKDWKNADHFIKSVQHKSNNDKYKIPKILKILFAHGLRDKALEAFESTEEQQQAREVLIETRTIMDEGITELNHITFFHHLLWWEEVIAKINLKKYNMTKVTLAKDKNGYLLEVPGLAEKRPSVLRGDKIYIRPSDQDNETIIFESTVKCLEDDRVRLADFDKSLMFWHPYSHLRFSFSNYYSESAQFDVRFLMSRVPMERMHEAVTKLVSSKQQSRVFPKPVNRKVALKPINRFYNNLIQTNEEQKSAVEHIVSGTSGLAPYIVFGPPGTGKTMTIVEAIIQLVVRNARNRVLVCTDSNMAADHITLMLLKYRKVLNINNYILRVNSQCREWSVLPPELAPVSNGTSFENYNNMRNTELALYRIVVTTLSHAAKYSTSQRRHQGQPEAPVRVSHLFIDEAAQASEPSALIPITGLLAPTGQLILAGDPMQLGPVCSSKEATKKGLGKSLLERLRETCSDLYRNDSNYITMLVKNFRSDPDILRLPNDLFYESNLQAFAKPDYISKTSILGLPGGERAIVFHAVHSREQRIGKAPSYFNEKELEMLQRYILALMKNHDVSPEDIGVIAPYIRQVYKMKAWLMEHSYDKIEVGTVEAFQGKEKRVILVSTVRANCKLLDYDARYGLGFLVDDKRFNVALTRAKAKIVIIGNPNCLTRDVKWRKYMELCEEYKCYFGKSTEQIERTRELLTEVARTRFDRIRLTEELKNIKRKDKKIKK